MHPDRSDLTYQTAEDPSLVSARFLSDLFRALEAQGIPATELLGDLPISLGEKGDVVCAVEWNDFCEFMRRLGHAVGGASGLERCGETLGQLAPARALNSLAGIAASPHTLYRAASGWVLRRAIPGLNAQLVKVGDGHFEIEARIADGLRDCPEIFHFATGGARVLPQIIGLQSAVVTSDIEPQIARYKIAAPPSSTLFAQAKRVFRTIFSAGAVLTYLEDQQLELHAKNDALQRANDALEESERRYRAMTDTAVDVLCEVDATGRILYVSASILELIGYSPEQVTGSHYRLWIPSKWHDRVEEAFAVLVNMPTGRATQELVDLHTHDKTSVLTEITARTYDTHQGERRVVVIIRDQSDRKKTNGALPAAEHAAKETTQDMAHIVERVMIGHTVSLDDAPRAEWLETRKLLRDVRDAFRDSAGDKAGGNGLRRDVEIDLDAAPAEIFANELLLVTALSGLLDWAAERNADPRDDHEFAGQNDCVIRVRLSVTGRLPAEQTPDSPSRITFQVETGSVEKVDDAPFVDSPTAQLAFEVAADAVHGMDGQLSGEAGTRWITLNQPDRASELN